MVFIIYKFRSLQKIKKVQFNELGLPGGTVARVGFKLTAPHASLTETGEWHYAMFLPDQQAVGCRTPTCGTWTTPSLTPPIKRAAPAIASFFPSHFLPNAEVRRPTAHHRLASIWLHHWAIPRTQVIRTPLRFY
jgi:hypothetical protein